MGFDGIIGRNQPKQIQRPMCRQAFRPGQWDSPKFGARSVTNIQNNFYGPQTNYRNWGDAWAGYDYYQQPQLQPQSESAKPGVLGWVGLAVGAAGGILGAILGNKKDSKALEEKGGDEPTVQVRESKVQVEPEPKDDTKVESEPKDDTKVETEPKDDTKVEEDPNKDINEFNWSNFSTDCRDVDANGNDKTLPIIGKVKVTESGGDKKAPKTFTITTANGNTYTFTKVESGDNDNKKVQYKCTQCITKGGATTEFTKGNIYTCEMQNGKPVLRQHDGDKGSGKKVGEE